jgi:hypothetical protein
VAAPILARIGSPALAVDQDGWVAAVDAMPLHNRILLPTNITDIAPGRVRLSTLGPCDIEPLPGGWLVRLATDDSAGQLAHVTLDLRNPDVPLLEMAGQFTAWRHDISQRHAEILLVLATSPAGRSATELADDLYGDSSRSVTVRAEVSRLRKQFTGLLAAQPYRFASTVDLDVIYPADISMLLPSSTAPFVRAARSRRGDGI